MSLSVFMRLREYILSSPLILRQIGLRRQQTATKNYPDQRWMCHAYVKCPIYLRSPICSLATIHGTRSNRHFITMSLWFISVKNQLQILDSYYLRCSVFNPSGHTTRLMNISLQLRTHLWKTLSINVIFKRLRWSIQNAVLLLPR